MGTHEWPREKTPGVALLPAAVGRRFGEDRRGNRLLRETNSKELPRRRQHGIGRAGIPTALASLVPRARSWSISGSGGGFDVFLAGPRVGITADGRSVWT